MSAPTLAWGEIAKLVEWTSSQSWAPAVSVAHDWAYAVICMVVYGAAARSGWCLVKGPSRASTHMFVPNFVVYHFRQD